MQQAEARGEALTKSRRYSKAGGYSGSGGAAAVHFLNKLASLASFICRLALSPLSLLSHIWMENWQAFCQQSHERLFSNLSARSNEFFSGGENPPWMWSLFLIRSFIFPFNLTSHGWKSGSLFLSLSCWNLQPTEQTHQPAKASALRSIARARFWNRWRGIKYLTAFSERTHRRQYMVKSGPCVAEVNKPPTLWCTCAQCSGSSSTSTRRVLKGLRVKLGQLLLLLIICYM